MCAARFSKAYPNESPSLNLGGLFLFRDDYVGDEPVSYPVRKGLCEEGHFWAEIA